MPDTIRIGVVGAGNNTRLHHIPKLQKIAGVEITSVVNRSRASSERVAKEFGIPRVHERWPDLVNDPGIDAVVIGTWPYLHCPVTLAALAAGKHVLTEARIAMNAAEARQMLAASRAKPHLVTQVVPGSFTTSCQVSCTRSMPNSWATFSEDARERLATDFTSTPAIFFSLGMWCSFVLPPAPTTPIRMVSGMTASSTTG
jgi:predicted homoserine dehydrogenase-like protein